MKKRAWLVAFVLVSVMGLGSSYVALSAAPAFACDGGEDSAPPQK